MKIVLSLRVALSPLFIFLLALATLTTPAWAQIYGGLDAGFNPGTGANDNVMVTRVQADGKVLVGGEFTLFNSSGFTRLVRLNANGTVDGGFSAGAGFNSTVEDVVVQADGKIIVAGHFTQVNNVNHNYLVRLESTGAIDSSFNPGIDGVVYEVLLQPDGKILLAGSFGNVNGQDRDNIARLHTDGTLDVGFVPPAISGAVHALGLQADNRILVGGSFSLSFRGVDYYFLVRIEPNGALEQQFNAYDPRTGYPINSTVHDLLVQPDQRILIAGSFTTVNGESRPHIARLMPSGRVDGTFNSGAGPNSTVQRIALQADGKVFIAGNFTQVASSQRKHVARLRATGALDSSFDPGVGPDALVDAISITGNNLIIGGDFQNVSGAPRNRVAQLAGGNNPVPGTLQVADVEYRVIENAVSVTVGVRRLDGSVGPITVAYQTGTGSTEGSAEVVSDFVAVAGTLNWGAGDTAEKQVIIPIVNDALTEIEERFTLILSAPTGGATLGEAATATIVIVNDDPGILDTTFDPGAGAYGNVLGLAVQADNKVVVGGDFNWVQGENRSRFARFNPDGTLDASFLVGSGANGDVYDVQMQPDGKILIGGAFSTVQGHTRNNLARLNSDGTLDILFSPGVDSTIAKIFLQADGKILLGGSFSEVNGVPRQGIARLNNDGSLDNAFQPPPIVSGTVLAIARHADGRIVIGGNFSLPSHGLTYYFLARLDEWGNLDRNFNWYDTTVGLPINSSVRDVAVQPDNRIVIAGDFTSVRNVQRQRLARLMPDGLLDGTFVTENGANGTIRTLALQPNGQVLIGGEFGQVASATRNNLARFNADGSLDTGFDPIAGPADGVSKLVLLPSGKVVLGGEFRRFSSFQRGGVARINSVVSPVSPGTFQVGRTDYYIEEWQTSVMVEVRRLNGSAGAASITYGTVDGTASAGSDYTLTGGTLNWANGETASKFVTINLLPDGQVEAWESFALKLSAPTGGAGLSEANTATITIENNDPGLLDPSFDPGHEILGSVVYDVAPQPDGKVIVVGDFTWVWGESRERVARLNHDGTLDPSFNPGTGANASARVAVVQPDQRVLIGGDFTLVDGQTRNYLARFESNGSLDPSFNPGLDNSVEALLLQSDNRIMVGGNFNAVNGETRDSIARLNPDGSLDLSFTPVVGISGSVRAIERQANGKYLVGGAFSLTFNGKSYYYLIRLNADGTLEEGFNEYIPANGLPINSTVEALAVQSDHRILIGGSFNAVSGAPRNFIARLHEDGTLDNSFDSSDGPGGTVFDLELQPDGNVLIGGQFTLIQSISRRNVARLLSTGLLDPTFNPGVGANDTVRTLALSPSGDGYVYIGGDFTRFNDYPRRGVARLQPGGTAAGTIALSSATYSVGENAGWVEITVTRTGGSAGAVMNNFDTQYDTAGPADLGAILSGSMLWGDGDATPRTFLVGITHDGLIEGNESFSARVFNVVGATLGAPSVATVTIIDNTGAAAGTLQFGSATYKVAEDGRVAQLEVTRTGGSTGRVQVNYGSSDGTAVAPGDYSVSSGIVYFEEGETLKPITIPIANDLASESLENFLVTLTAPTGGAVLGATAAATVLIQDNELVPAAGTTDLAFNPGAGADGEVRAVAQQADGKFLVGGDFVQFAGLTVNRLARLNANGSIEGGFSVGFNAAVEAIAVQADNKILIGGHFTTAQGVTRHYLARAHPNGSLDTFNAGVDGVVNAILVQPDQKIVIGGSFNVVGGTTHRSVARLNADGSVDNTFNPPVDGAALAVALQPDGKIIVAGGINAYNYRGLSYQFVLRLNSDGTLDESFGAYNPNTGYLVNSTVQAVAVQTDGRIVIGGDFSVVGADGRSRLARLMPDGSLDRTFDPGSAVNGAVYSVAVQDDGKVVIGGRFTQVALAERPRLARLHATGALDTSFYAEVTPANGSVDDLLLLGGGRVLIAGEFDTVNGEARNGIAIINNGSAPSGGTIQLANVAYRVQENAGNAIIKVRRLDGGVGAASVHYQTATEATPLSAEIGTDYNAAAGTLTWIDGETAEKQIAISILNDSVTEVEEVITLTLSDATGAALGEASVATITIVNDDAGMLDLSFDPTDGTLGEVEAVAVQSDDKVIAVGEFTFALGANRSRIARFNADGTLDTGFDPVGGANGRIHAVAIQPDGKILIGGDFTQFAGVPHNYIARLNANGTLDSFSAQANGSVYSILVDAFGILIGGNFSEVNGVNRDGVALLNMDGSVAVGFSAGPPISGAVHSLARQTDGKILLGGSFSITTAGATYYFLARLNPNGSIETGFNEYNPSIGLPINSTVRTLQLQPNGRILIGGDFTAALGQSYPRVARLMPDGTLDGTFRVAAGANSTVRTLALQADGNVLLGGAFTQVANARRTHLARLNSDGSLDTGFDPVSIDGHVNDIALSSAGKHVLGGDFSKFASFTRGGVARINPVAELPLPGSIQVTATDFYADESAGTVTVTVRRHDGSAGAVSVAYTTLDGTAEAGLDYTAASGALNWANGDNADKQIVISIANDALVEEDETIIVHLSNPTGGAGLDEAHNAIVHIVNDDLEGGLLDLSFAPNSGANGQVYDVAVDSSDRVIIGGEFTQVNGVARSRIARLNSDGTLDTSFDPGAGANSTVETVAIQADGRILIGGSFNLVDGRTRSYLARFEDNGDLDESFTVGVDSTVSDIMIEPNGQILIAGSFNEVNGVPTSQIVRLNEDGSLDLFFQAPVGISGPIRTIAKQSDGRILIGGSFGVAEFGMTTYYIARLFDTGQLDRSFANDPISGPVQFTVNSTVHSIAVQADDRIILGGDFNVSHGLSAWRIVRLMPNGLFDGTFETDAGANNSVRALTALPSGQVVMGGSFTSVSGVTRNRIARLNHDGSVDAAFDPGSGPNASIESIALMPNGKLVVGGDFTMFNSYVRQRVARLNSIPAAVSAGSLQVAAISYRVHESEGFVAVGFRRIDGSSGPISVNYETVPGTATGADFAVASGTLSWLDGETGEAQIVIPIVSDGFAEGPETFAVKLSNPVGVALGAANATTVTIVDNDPGLLDLSFDPSNQVAGAVFAVAPQADGKVLVGGTFGWVWGISRNNIARLNVDGSLDWTFNPGTGVNSSVNSILVQTDQRIVIAGEFTTADGQYRSHILRFESNGSIDPSFNAGVDGSIETMLLQGDGRIVIGGTFNTVNGQRRDGLARLNTDGSLDLHFHPPVGISGQVRALARQADGKYLVGGSFSLIAEGQTYYYFIRLDANGTLESGFNDYIPANGLPINSTVESIIVQPDQRILLGGHFTSVHGSSRHYVVRLHGDNTIDGSFDIGSGPNNAVRGMALQADGKVVIGGHFTQVQDTSRRYVARLGANGLLDTTFDPRVGADGVVQTVALVPGSAGLIYIGGDFSSFSGFTRHGVARLQSGGAAAGVLALTTATYAVNENGGNALVTVSRTGGSAGSVGVTVATANASATAGTDYSTVTTTLAWGEGDVAPKSVLVPISNDAIIEGNEAFTVQLSSATGGATLGAIANAMVTILDNSAAQAGSFAFASAIYNVSEEAGSVALTVSRTGGSAGLVQLDVASADVTASSSSDFTPISEVISFGDGETSKTIEIPILNDLAQEGLESFTVTLSSPTGGATLGAAATTTVNIFDNETAPVAGALNLGFDPAAGANSEIHTVLVQPDGKILVGGEFTQFDGVTVNRIARLNADGSRDPLFGAGQGFNSAVEALAVQADGKILVGGSFTTINTVSRQYLARLNADGSLDVAFNAGVDSTVNSILVQADGRIVIAGSFNNVGGQVRHSIARLNANGSIDLSFESPMDGNVISVIRQPDNKFLVAGNFGFTFKGRSYYFLARLNSDGSLEEGFNEYNPAVGLPINSTVQTVALQADGRIVIGGDFTSVRNVSRARVARLTADGQLDPTFDAGAGANSTVYSLALQPDGRVVLGGRFTHVALAERLHLARLLATGALDTSFYAEVGPGNTAIDQLLLLGIGHILIAGDFTSVNGVARNRIAVLDNAHAPAAGTIQMSDLTYRVPESASIMVTVRRLDGSVGAATVRYRTSTIAPPLSAEEGSDFTPVTGTLTWADGDMSDRTVIISIVNDTISEVEEQFTFALSDAKGAALGTESVASIFIVNDDAGLLDLPFDSGAGTLGRVEAVAVQSDDKVIAVGNFDWALGARRGGVARFNSNGTLDNSFDSGTGANTTINAVAIQADGKVLIGGEFTVYNGATRNYLARLNANGTLDTAFNPGINSSVQSIFVDASGILIGGNFSQVNSQPRQSLARLNADGSIDPTFLPPPFSGGIMTIARQSSGDIIVGGNFSVFEAGITYYYLARVSSTGVLDPDFNPYDPSVGLPINSTVQTVVVQPDQRILIGGDFTAVRNEPRQRIARLMPDSELDGSFSLGTGANSSVMQLALQSDGKILLVGRFTRVAEAARNYLARLNSDGSVDTAFDPIAGPDGEVTSVAMAGGGKAVIGGDFNAFSNFQRGHVARIKYVPTVATPGSFQVAETILYVNEADGLIQVPVRRLQGWSGNVSVSYKTVGGAASAASDFTAVTGTLNWGAGDTTDRIVTIPITNDPVVEANETLRLVLHSPVGGALDDAFEATIVIVNDDPGLLNLTFDPDDAVLGNVNDVKVQSDGKVVIGGDFSWVWRNSRNRIARLNSDGTLDPTFNPGSGANSTVNAVAIQADGKILIAGEFTTVNGVGRKYLARFESNGSLDADFNPGIDGSIESLELVAGNKLLIGGSFNQVNGETRGRVARLNNDGSLDLGFGPPSGISGAVHSVAQQPDGKVLAGGSFSFASGGVTYYYLLRLNANGSLETGFNVYNPAIGLPINSTVLDIELQADQKILIGGSFNQVGQVQSGGVARLNADGTRDPSFNVGNGANNVVDDVELQPNGKVLIVGGFTQVQGTSRIRVARLNTNGLLDVTLDPYFGPNDRVHSVFSVDNDTLYIGGDFSQFNSFTRVGVARLLGIAEPPTLVIQLFERTVRLSWPVSSTGFTLVQEDDIGANAWIPSTEAVTIEGDEFVVRVPGVLAARFFQLRSP